ncbi:MAG: HyaD/HybD family hydrogenase maturation endopeptidase [Dissulfurispiraceae bacterium]|nr:HyaD/HybD family hydrogenase maturation endopeptidase [Dissulfurispiraceae bacterium]
MESSKTPKVSVIGLGNILMMDEGIGVMIAKKLGQRIKCDPEVEFFDGGTKGLELMPYIEGREKILVIDAVDFGRDPGYIGVLRNDEIPAALQSKMSVHNIGLADIMFVLKLSGIQPSEICLLGIQPKKIELGLEPTEEINSKIPQLIEYAVDILREWNIECVSLSPQS